MTSLRKAIIVTGGTGFIGSALVKELRDREPSTEVISIGTKTVDLSNAADTFAHFGRLSKDYDCSQIFHLAALYKAGGWPVKHPATQFFVNMSINVNVMEAWRRYFSAAKMLTVLSYCMYPPGEHPHAEGELWGTEPEEYLFAYAMTKKAMLIGQRAYRIEHSLSASAVILPTVYGPGDSFEEDSHVMGALIGKFVRAARAGSESVEIWGSGSQEREFLYVADAVKGIVTASIKARSEAINIGTGRAHPIRQIAKIIKELAGFTGKIQFNEDRFVGVGKRVMDVRLAAQEIGWTAPTDIETGIKKSVEWYNSKLASGSKIVPKSA